MSNTSSWIERSETHRYSQDDKSLAWKYQKELEPIVDKFLADYTQQRLIIGTFNLEKEPWRMISIIYFRKYQIKIIEKVVPAGTEITLTKIKMTSMVG